MTDFKLQDRTFLLILVLVTMAMLAILWPYWEAVFWGVSLAILFAPLHRKLLARMPKHRNLAALSTLLVCLFLVILPLTVLSLSLVQEATLLYERLRSGKLNFGDYLQQVITALPQWAIGWLDRMELTSLSSLQAKFSAVSVQASQLVATRAVNIGQNTLQFVVSFGVMLYLLDTAGVACSAGSACTAGVTRPSHVLLACGVPEDLARGALRLTLGRTSTEADVDAFLAALPEVLEKARRARGAA